ncbi:MAG: GNAT family N-acetyltransferase [Pseudomonadaceae bacterium]|nr:GNAT family N-acetyltransferase [Pseudomonadaceae bacterium]
MSNEAVYNAYPKNVALPDGATVELRQMTASDRDAILAFARALPQEDLMFLRLDLTEDSVVDAWVQNLATGHTFSIVAYDSDGLIGYASVHRNPTSWTRHMGEIRVNVNPEYRSRGLGRVLISNIFDLASALGLRKITAHMTSDQRGAQAAFRHLGFVPEALLADYVQDRKGTTRDMVIMSFDVTGHTDQSAGTLRV